MQKTCLGPLGNGWKSILWIKVNPWEEKNILEFALIITKDKNFHCNFKFSVEPWSQILSFTKQLRLSPNTLLVLSMELYEDHLQAAFTLTLLWRANTKTAVIHPEYSCPGFNDTYNVIEDTPQWLSSQNDNKAQIEELSNFLAARNYEAVTSGIDQFRKRNHRGRHDKCMHLQRQREVITRCKIEWACQNDLL